MSAHFRFSVLCIVYLEFSISGTMSIQVPVSKVSRSSFSVIRDKRLAKISSEGLYDSQVAPATRISQERIYNQLVSVADTVSQMQFPMHTVTIQDLLAFDRLPNFDEVMAMSKFVVPSEDDPRPVLFISHQWCSYSHPDPTNQQFASLQGALRTLMAGMIVKPTDIGTGSGKPPTQNFAGMLKNCLGMFFLTM